MVMPDYTETIRTLEWCLQPDQRGHYGWIAQPALEVIRELQSERNARDRRVSSLKAEIGVWLQYADKLRRRAEAAEARADALERERNALLTFRTSDEWHEDIGDVLWWDKRDGGISEPPYVGSPLSDDWPEYHTHWTPLPFSRAAAFADQQPDQPAQRDS